MPQALVGKNLKPTPKNVRVNAAEHEALVYKNLGDGNRVPLLWAKTVTLASGSTPEAVVASGVEFYGFKACDALIFPALSTSGTGSVSSQTIYVIKDTTNNIVKVKTTATLSASQHVDVLFLMGSTVVSF